MGPCQVFIWFSYHQACFDFRELSGHNPSVMPGERKCRRSEARVAQAGAAQGSRTGKRLPGLCRTPKNSQSPSVTVSLHSSPDAQPLAQVGLPRTQSCLLSSQRRMGGGNLAGKQNPLAASGLAQALSLDCWAEVGLVPPSAAL